MLLKYIEKKQKFRLIGLRRYLRDTKKNSIKVDLHRARKISTNFKEEVKFIRNKFIKADFSLPFINSIIKHFNNQQKIVQQNNKEELIIPLYFSEVESTFLLPKLLYCGKK